MMKRRCLLAMLVSTVVVGCHAKPLLPDYRYRMTVEIETPTGLKSGSSIIEVSSSIASKDAFPIPSNVSTQVHGEAAAVDLGAGRVLFALLSKPGRAEGANSYALDAFYAKPWTGADQYLHEVNEMVHRRDVGVVPAKAYPMLITFGDLRNPKSVVEVDPTNLARSFGAGVVLKRVTVQMTDAQVSTGIEKRLGWLNFLRNGGMLSGQNYNSKENAALNLAYFNFKQSAPN